MTLATDLIPWLKERVRGRGDGCFYSRLLDQPVGEHFIEVATSPEGWEEAMSRGCVPCTAAEKNPVDGVIP